MTQTPNKPVGTARHDHRSSMMKTEPKKTIGILHRARFALLLACLLANKPAFAQPQGGAIAPAPAVVTNSAPAAGNQTNSPLVLQTNKAGEIVVDFGILSSFPLDPAENLVRNTNQVKWADEQVNAMIPNAIKNLDGKKIAIEGFMLPTVLDKGGKVTEFILMANQMSCCYGGPTQFHDFITIRVKGPAVNSNIEATVPVTGVLRVGALRQNGQLVGIYQMECEHLSIPKSD